MLHEIFEPAGRATIFAVALGAAAFATSPAGATDEGGSISGVWNSSIGAVYQVWQYNDRFIWWADSLHETAMGRIQGSTIHASWSGTNGDGSGAAIAKNFDADGRAHRIEWSNGVVFMR